MAKKVSKAAAASLYDVHPGVAIVRNWIDALPQKTGRSLAEWLRLVRNDGPATVQERCDWLKAEHKLGTNSAWWIAERADGKGMEDSDPATYLKAAAAYVKAMYTGPKAHLRPLHDELLKLGRALGNDVRVCPCKTIVPLYRKRVFAEIKPSTQTRIDFGLALGATSNTPARLINTGGFAKKDRITHRFVITSLGQIDDEVKHWLKVAYDLDG